MLAVSEDMFAFLFVVVFKVIFGAICAGIASGRGRNVAGWFFVGMALDCLGLVLVLVLPNLKVLEAEKQRAEQENRRLREQLAKERQVADQRHGHVERRLGAHDQALGVDTAAVPELGHGGIAPPTLPGAANAVSWFYARGKERMGPVSEETVRHLLQAGAIKNDTLVWREGMVDWQQLGSTSEFHGDVA